MTIFKWFALNDLDNRGNPQFWESARADFEVVSQEFDVSVITRRRVITEAKGAQTTKGFSDQPPRLAEKILILSLSPRKYRDNQIGDLAEDFAKFQHKYGRKFATLWYWKEVVREVWLTLPKFIRLGTLVPWLIWLLNLIYEAVK